MLADAAKYKELQEQKEGDLRVYQETQTGIYEQHSATVNDEQRIHNKHCEQEMAMIQYAQQEIERMKLDNAETMKQIEEDSEKEIADAKRIFETKITQVMEMGLKSKAEV